MAHPIKIMSVFLMTLIIIGFTPKVEAVVHTLIDSNSTVTIEDNDTLSATPVTSPLGIQSWVVDGINHMGAGGSHWYYHPTNYPPAGLLADEVPLGTAPMLLNLSTTTDLNPPNGKPEHYYASYSDGYAMIEIDMLLTGGNPGDGKSMLATEVKVTNITGITDPGQEPIGAMTIDLDLFEHLDLDLGGTAGDDTGRMVDAHTYVQSDDDHYFEKVITHHPEDLNFFAYEIGLVPSILSLFSDGVPIGALPNIPPIGTGITGNVEAAFQWSITLDPGEQFGISYLISQDAIIGPNSEVIPEPSTYLLLGTTLAVGICLKRKKEQVKA